MSSWQRELRAHHQDCQLSKNLWIAHWKKKGLKMPAPKVCNKIELSVKKLIISELDWRAVIRMRLCASVDGQSRAMPQWEHSLAPTGSSLLLYPPAPYSHMLTLYPISHCLPLAAVHLKSRQGCTALDSLGHQAGQECEHCSQDGAEGLHFPCVKHWSVQTFVRKKALLVKSLQNVSEKQFSWAGNPVHHSTARSYLELTHNFLLSTH